MACVVRSSDARAARPRRAKRARLAGVRADMARSNICSGVAADLCARTVKSVAYTGIAIWGTSLGARAWVRRGRVLRAAEMRLRSAAALVTAFVFAGALA